MVSVTDEINIQYRKHIYFCSSKMEEGRIKFYTSSEVREIQKNHKMKKIEK